MYCVKCNLTLFQDYPSRLSFTIWLKNETVHYDQVLVFLPAELPRREVLPLPNRKFLVISLVALAFFSAPQALPTTVVAIVTPHGIVIGSDAKTLLTENRVPTASGSRPSKVELVKDRILVATAGFFAGGGYEFHDWINKVSRNLPGDVSVQDFVSALNRESAKEFQNFGPLATGKLARPPFSPSYDIFVQYLVAGYEGGFARMLEINFFVDWKKKFIGAPKTNVVPISSEDLVSIHLIGERGALNDIRDGDSYSHKQALRIAPGAFAKIFSGEEITECEAVLAAGAIVRIQETATPSKVGGLGRFYYLPRTGVGRESSCTLLSRP
ncbi:MAG: hypothetical protein JO119_17465 [Acidobacteria bacterium]|nr:hypothetical protein [Acidobacteriota bacterium]